MNMIIYLEHLEVKHRKIEQIGCWCFLPVDGVTLELSLFHLVHATPSLGHQRNVLTSNQTKEDCKYIQQKLDDVIAYNSVRQFFLCPTFYLKTMKRLVLARAFSAFLWSWLVSVQVICSIALWFRIMPRQKDMLRSPYKADKIFKVAPCIL